MYATLRCDPKLFEKDLNGRTYIVTGANSGSGLVLQPQLYISLQPPTIVTLLRPCLMPSTPE
jgi:hypothetical protein